ncbi:hypothetical protein LV828_15470 [[Clostridium] innocuum]|uniref:hypothetical protein n=1 Tax=Clostridium innocuum TaxID=1522 RepID=UPI0015F2DF84|nr:hypothetical protein [[Clostridium] innocuum]MBS9791920.1 hypothetical protein [[Clostridium] innocuum]MCH1944211.1 hypothetical protein [[Clostridium] innocuum]MCH1955094.1 hypothetical protein [[Clostridium] innocuum]MCI2984336.1 hypothetical protein [[Clostridium] innocuum]MCR0336886.1 hypothetical protein [[Clostridium] innocuum]
MKIHLHVFAISPTLFGFVVCPNRKLCNKVPYSNITSVTLPWGIIVYALNIMDTLGKDIVKFEILAFNDTLSSI